MTQGASSASANASTPAIQGAVFDPNTEQSSGYQQVAQNAPLGTPQEPTGPLAEEFRRNAQLDKQATQPKLTPGAVAPTAKPSKFAPRIQELEAPRPPTMSKWLGALTPDQRQAVLTGSVSVLGSPKGSFARPASLQRMEEMRTEDLGEIEYKKKQLLSVAMKQLSDDPSDDDSASAVLTLATDLGQDPMAWQRSARLRQSMISLLTQEGEYKDQPAAAARVVDSNMAPQELQARMARRERIKTSQAQLRALNLTNASPTIQKMAAEIAAEGGDVSTFVQDAASDTQFAEAAERYASILTQLRGGIALFGQDLFGKPTPGSMTPEQATQKMQEITKTSPKLAKHIYDLNNDAVNRFITKQEAIQRLNLAQQAEKRHDRELEIREKEMRYNNEVRSWSLATRFTPMIHGVDQEIGNIQLLYPKDDDARKSALAELKQRKQQFVDQQSDAISRHNMEFKPETGIEQDKAHYDMKLRVLEKMSTDPDSRNKQIQRATIYLQALEANKNIYGHKSKEWVRDVYNPMRERITNILQGTGVEVAPPGSTGSYVIPSPALPTSPERQDESRKTFERKSDVEKGKEEAESKAREDYRRDFMAWVAQRIAPRTPIQIPQEELNRLEQEYQSVRPPTR